MNEAFVEESGARIRSSAVMMPICCPMDEAEKTACPSSIPTSAGEEMTAFTSKSMPPPSGASPVGLKPLRMVLDTADKSEAGLYP